MSRARLSKRGVIALIAGMLIACGERDVRPPSEEGRILQQLRSAEPTDVRAGLSNAERLPQLSPVLIEQLVLEMGNPKYGHLLVNDTLVTSETPVTRILAEHPESGEPLRRALAEGKSPQIKRFAAYVLGEMRYAAAIPELRVAIGDSITASSDDSQRGTELDPRAMLTAAVDAYAKIDSRNLVEFLLPFVEHRRFTTRQFACRSLWRVVRPDTGAGLFTDAEIRSGECGRRWSDWWIRSKALNNDEIFRWSTSHGL